MKQNWLLGEQVWSGPVNHRTGANKVFQQIKQQPGYNTKT